MKYQDRILSKDSEDHHSNLMPDFRFLIAADRVLRLYKNSLDPSENLQKNS